VEVTLAIELLAVLAVIGTTLTSSRASEITATASIQGSGLPLKVTLRPVSQSAVVV